MQWILSQHWSAFVEPTTTSILLAWAINTSDGEEEEETQIKHVFFLDELP